MSQKKQVNYISLTQAAKGTPYSQEYLSLRARQGKLKAVKHGRAWVTTRAWVDEYIEQSSWDQKKQMYQANGTIANNQKSRIHLVRHPEPAGEGSQKTESISKNISLLSENMRVPQPPAPRHLLSFWARMGAACTLFTRVILTPAVLERVLVGSLIGILAVTALLGGVGFFQGPKPPPSGPFGQIITGMEVVWHTADEMIDEWDRSRERVIARGLIEQQEQSKVAGVKIYADDVSDNESWTSALANGMNTVVEKIIKTVRLDE